MKSPLSVAFLNVLLAYKVMAPGRSLINEPSGRRNLLVACKFDHRWNWSPVVYVTPTLTCTTPRDTGVLADAMLGCFPPIVAFSSKFEFSL